ncbi:MAG: nucleotidyltransferase family protein [Coleofasciculus sp. S288]|nr:nucleotidyltransferase family protein [Coleofasciculus sp. S288]
MLVKNIEISEDQITDFCQRWNIIELALFGSVLRDDFRPDSDIDLLVNLAPDSHWTLSKMIRMQEELEALFGRKVDLVSKQTIETSRNYLRRKAILSSAKVIYASS